MPAQLGGRSFGFRAAAADRLVVLAGTPVYDTVNVPPGGASATSMGGNGVSVRAPWHNDPAASLFEPSTDEFWFHANYFTNLNNTNNDSLRLGVGSVGTELITVSAEDTTNKLTIRVAGLVRATALVDAFSVGVWKRLHVHVSGLAAADVVSVYTDGNLSVPVVSYALTNGDATSLAAAGTGKPNEFWVTMKSGDGNGRSDDLLAWDPTDAAFPGINFFQSAAIKEQVFVADGPEVDWSGDYTAIDELPPSDTDKRTASAVGDQFSGTTAAIGEPNVFAVRVVARVTRTGTDAGSNLTVRTNDGTNTEDRTMAAPGDGYVTASFDKAPDGGAWSPVKRDAVRIGFETVT